MPSSNFFEAKLRMRLSPLICGFRQVWERWRNQREVGNVMRKVEAESEFLGSLCAVGNSDVITCQEERLVMSPCNDELIGRELLFLACWCCGN